MIENANARMQSMTTRMEISSSQNAQNLPRKPQLAARMPRRLPAPQSRQRALQQVPDGRNRANLDLQLRQAKMLRQRRSRRSLEGSSRQVRRPMLRRRLRVGLNVLSKKYDRRHHRRQCMQRRMQITIAHQVLDFDRSL